MTVSDKLLEFSEYEMLIRPSQFEDISKLGTSYQYLEFTGDAGSIRKKSYNAVIKDLQITGHTLYILLFCNNDKSLDTIDLLGLSLLIENVKQKIEFVVFILPTDKVKKPLKLLLIYEQVQSFPQ